MLRFAELNTGAMAILILFIATLLGAFNDVNAFYGSAKILAKKSNSLSMKLISNFDALLFDCDGVIAETERGKLAFVNNCISFHQL
jgi:hypothetical protein